MDALLSWLVPYYSERRTVAAPLVRRELLVRCLSVALTTVFFALVVVPLTPSSVKAGLDHSWVAVLHDSHHRHLQFGSDIIFTYGPLGFVLTNTFHPATYRVTIGVMLACVISGSLVLDQIRARYIPDWRLGILWLLALPFLSGRLEIPFDLALLFLACRVSARDGRCYPAELILAAVLGLMGLTKFTGCVASFGVLVFSAIEDVFRWRRVPWSLTIFVVSLLTAWLALGQELAGLPRYLWTSLEISRGYTDAMSLPGRQWMALMYLVAIGLLAYPLAVVSWRNNGRWAVVPVAMFALTTMVIFKAAFVRADEHVEIGFRAAIMVILLLLPVLWTACSTPPLRRLLLASFVPVFLSGYSFAVFPSTMAHTISAIRNNVRWLASPGQGYETLQRCHDEALATIATEHSLPEPAGSVDIYNFQQSRLLAHPWDYRQRPIIQSYSAYTQSLLRLNADHLRGADAPDTIYFTLQEIDQRWPAQMDSLSWPELLSRYEPTRMLDFGDGTLRLDKRPHPATVEWLPLETRTVRLGETISLPDWDSKLVWARIHLRPTLAKRLSSLVYKSRPVRMVVNDRGPYRLIPEIAESGFLLSPVTETTADFRDLYGRPGTTLDVARIRVDAWRYEYDAEFTLELMELRVTDK